MAAPTVNAGSDVVIAESDTLATSGFFTDPDPDVWTATVDYGDGSGVESLPLNSDKTFSLGHTYLDNGEFTVTVTVSDQDGGVGSDTLLVRVENTPPTAVLSNDGPVDEGNPVMISFSSPSDASEADTAAGFHYAFSCDGGDLSGATYASSGTASTKTCTFEDGDDIRLVRARIIDKDDGFTEKITEVIVNDVAPTFEFIEAGTVDEGSVYTLSLEGFDPGADTIVSWTIDWGDGTIPEMVPGNPATAGHVYLDGSNTYNISISATNEDGVFQASDGLRVDVANVAASALELTLDSDVIEENGTARISGRFADPGVLDQYRVLINWGADEETTNILLPAGEFTFSSSHRYLDDNPTATPSDRYPITVELIDNKDGGSTTGSIDLTVNNVSPVVRVDVVEVSGASGDTLFGSGFFTDPGPDTWTATVDYGDGSGTQSLPLNLDKTFDLAYRYGANGEFTVTVTVIDDDGGVGSHTIIARITDLEVSPLQTLTIVEDLTANGLTADDPLAPGWQLTLFTRFTTYWFARASDGRCSQYESASGTLTFSNLPNGSTAPPYSDTRANCFFELEVDADGDGIRGESDVRGERIRYTPPATTTSYSLGALPPPGEYWTFTGGDASTTAVVRLPIIAGTVFEDHDGDGVRDTEDQPIANAEVIYNFPSDLRVIEFWDGTGDPVAGGRSLPARTFTNSSGEYAFFGLPNEQVRLRVYPPGTSYDNPPSPDDPFSETRVVTTGNSQLTIVVTTSGMTPRAGQLFQRDLGAFLRSPLEGILYHDLNGNGQRDLRVNGEEDDEELFGYFPITISPDSNGDGRWDMGDCMSPFFCRPDSVARTGTFGAYSVLGPGNFGPLLPTEPDGTPTYSATEGSAGHTARSGVDPANGNRNFGIFQHAFIFAGQVYEDGDNSGAFDSHDDRLLPGITVELDLYNNGTVDRTTTTGQFGEYRFLNIGPGTHRISQVLPQGLSQSQPFDPRGYLITPRSGESVQELFFGQTAGCGGAIASATAQRGGGIIAGATGEVGQCVPGRFIVNDARDLPDADPIDPKTRRLKDDGRCDADLQTPGEQCTLRAAIENVNKFGRANRGVPRASIRFLPSISTLTPDLVRGDWPTISWPVDLDGLDGRETRVVLSGPADQLTFDGLNLAAGNSVVRGLVINGFRNGIIVRGKVKGDAAAAAGKGRVFGGNTIEQNLLGLDVTGRVRVPNGQDGIQIVSSAKNTVQFNTVSGSGRHGVYITGRGRDSGQNMIISNRIGTNIDGTDRRFNGGDGVFFENSVGTKILRNLISGNVGDGITVGLRSDETVIQGNTIGLNAAGDSPIANTRGVVVQSSNNTIGGANATEGNVISGNFSQILLRNQGRDNKILGNRIGTRADGMCLISGSGSCSHAGGSGVFITDAINTIVGGLPAQLGVCEGPCNVISGNTVGITSLSMGTQILGNFIGPAIDGSSRVGNSRVGIHDPGILLDGSRSRIESNRIAFNGGPGILVNGIGHSILGNQIFDNTAGVFLDDDDRNDGPLPNDERSGRDERGRRVEPDSDDGSNGFQNYPTIELESVDGVLTGLVRGVLISTPGETFRIDIFTSDDCDPTGYGEGQDFLGSVLAVNTDKNTGRAEFTFEIPRPLSQHLRAYVTATATEVRGGNTSEFSRCAPEPPQPDGGAVQSQVVERPDSSTPFIVTSRDRRGRETDQPHTTLAALIDILLEARKNRP